MVLFHSPVGESILAQMWPIIPFISSCKSYFPLDYHLTQDQRQIVSMRPQSDALCALQRGLVEG